MNREPDKDAPDRVTAEEWTRTRGGWLRLAGPTGQLRRLLSTTNLERRLGLYDSLADALVDSGAE